MTDALLHVDGGHHNEVLYSRSLPALMIHFVFRSRRRSSNGV